MKKFYLLFLSLAVIASACKDPEPEPEIPVEEATNIIKDAATDYDGNTYVPSPEDIGNSAKSDHACGKYIQNFNYIL